MVYSSINKIKSDFNIEDDDLEIIRGKLNKLRIENHPDKTSGAFKNTATEKKYHKVNDAIAFIDKLKSNSQIVVIEQLTDLVKSIAELVPNSTQANLKSALDSQISNRLTSYRSRSFIPKISLSAITVFLTFLLLVPKQIKDNPTLNKHIDPTDNVFFTVWIIFLVYTLLFWIAIYFIDEKAKNRLNHLKIDSFQNKVFKDFLNVNRSNIFSKDQLMDHIYFFNDNRRVDSDLGSLTSILRRPFFLTSNAITAEIAQSTAEIIITRAEKNNIITRVSLNSLSDSYKVINRSSKSNKSIDEN